MTGAKRLPLFHASRPLGRLARLPLRLIPKDTVLPILAGPGRGLRWIAGAGPHSIWLGLNELAMRRAFASAIRPGMTVYDIGANVGSFTLIAARRAGADGRVIAFEPQPDAAALLERHLQLNGVTNVTLIRAAVWHESGSVRFAPHDDRLQSHVAETGSLEVEAVRIDDLVKDGKAPPPDVIKIDVEGAEGEVLEGARETLLAFRPSVFFATHGEWAVARSHRVVLGLGYRVLGVGGSGEDWVAVSGGGGTAGWGQV